MVALSGTQDATKADLFMSLSEAKEQHAGGHDDAFFPVLTCRSCGQHFFESPMNPELQCARLPGGCRIVAWHPGRLVGIHLLWVSSFYDFSRHEGPSQ